MMMGRKRTRWNEGVTYELVQARRRESSVTYERDVKELLNHVCIELPDVALLIRESRLYTQGVMHQWQLRNKDKIKEYAKMYQKRNKDKFKLASRRFNYKKSIKNEIERYIKEDTLKNGEDE
jgi:hypothetical protein